MKPLPKPPLLVITDRTVAQRSLIAVVAAVFAGGCRWLMVREKDLPRDALAALTREILTLARPAGAVVVLNGPVEVAVEVGAHGLHLQRPEDVAVARQYLGANAWVGMSTHSLAEARAAEQAGADYITFSPVFASLSKPGYGPLPGQGLAALREVARSVSVPVIALGGITPERVPLCLQAGAAGVAVLGYVMKAANPRAAVQALIHALGGDTDETAS